MRRGKAEISGCRVALKEGHFLIELGADVQKDLWTLGFHWLGGEDADRAVGMKAVHEPSARCGGNVEPLSCDGHAAVVTDADAGATDPEVVPPVIALAGPQSATFGTTCPVPRLSGCHVQFAVFLLVVVMFAQLFQQHVA